MKKIALFLLPLLYATEAYPQTADIYQRHHDQALEIYKQMSLDEKIGQLLVPSYGLLASSVSKNGVLCRTAVNNPTTKKILIHNCGLDQIKQYHIGAVLTGGGPYFNPPLLKNWVELNNLAVEQHKAGSPHDPLLLTGNDAVHGNMHVQGTVIFPHNIGIGVAHDPELVNQMAYLVGQDSLASGFNWVYAPTVAVAHDLRWGRTYESFGENPVLVKTLTKAYVNGLQNIHNRQLRGPLATAKHFIGDGATQYGLDEGDAVYQGNKDDFWKENGQGYEAALQADVGSIMVSYSAVNGDSTRMHFGGAWNILNQCKNQGIKGADGTLYLLSGFAVSDWNGSTRAAYFYNQKNKPPLTLPQIMAKSINAGVDILMLGESDTRDPFDLNSLPTFTQVGEVFAAVKLAYQNGLIPEARLQDAVTRVLAVKLAMQPQTPQNYATLQMKERQLALKIAEKSLVLLKNENKTLPLDRHLIKNVVFIGDTDDLGLQNGGWTINWQGQKGNQYFTGKDKISSGATTLEEAIKLVLGKKEVNYYHVNKKQNDVPPTLTSKNTIVISLVSEVPYAEFMGDIGNPEKQDDWYLVGAKNHYNNYMTLPQNQFLGLIFSSEAAEAIQMLKQRKVKIITVVYSGRPVVLTEGDAAAPLTNSDAVIAAFLPGTLGGKALANAIFGDYHFKSDNPQSNSLTFPWPRNMSDVANHFEKSALFVVGYGLSN